MGLIYHWLVRQGPSFLPDFLLCLSELLEGTLRHHHNLFKGIRNLKAYANVLLSSVNGSKPLQTASGGKHTIPYTRCCTVELYI